MNPDFQFRVSIEQI